jgi:hypothetical protein
MYVCNVCSSFFFHIYNSLSIKGREKEEEKKKKGKRLHCAADSVDFFFFVFPKQELITTLNAFFGKCEEHPLFIL